ncbi:MAG: aldo/keto reductase [Rhodothermales bacterium]|nr:aldo/keto reductase [Rhodothermales bacterium]
MRYKILGRSGLRVSELALGTMTFGTDWGWGATRDESQAIFDRYAEAGGNFIDTANRYTEGTSEQFVGDFVRADRDHFVLATKYTLFDRREDPNFSGNHRKNMMRSVEASLKRLDTECIDLFWLHAWDFSTPIDEVMRGLDDLVRQGNVLYVGISDTPAWIVSQANTIADFRGWSRFIGLQIRYSLIDRAAERDLLPMAKALGLGVTPWSILGAGVLTGKYNGEDQPEEGRAKAGAATVKRNLTIAQACIDIATELGCSPSQVAIRWVMQQPQTIVPLIGARNLAQLNDNLGVLDISLNDTHLARLEDVSQFEPGFPHDFLTSDGVRDLVFGGTHEQIDFWD